MVRRLRENKQSKVTSQLLRVESNLVIPTTSNRPANVITVSGSGANAGFVNFWPIPIFASDCSTILPLDSKELDVDSFTMLC